MRYRNVSGEHRTWPTLINADTGRTLELDDGEDAEVAGKVTDDRLSPVRPPAPAPTPAPAPEPAAEPSSKEK